MFVFCFFYFYYIYFFVVVVNSIHFLHDAELMLLNISERWRVEHESSAAGWARDSDTTVGLLLLQTADQHTGPQLMGEKVRPHSDIHVFHIKVFYIYIYISLKTNTNNHVLILIYEQSVFYVSSHDFAENIFQLKPTNFALLMDSGPNSDILVFIFYTIWYKYE